jgi:hypothetical protein
VLHLHLDCTSLEERQSPAKSTAGQRPKQETAGEEDDEEEDQEELDEGGGGADGANGDGGEDPALMQLARLRHLRELKLTGPSGELMSAALVRLQEALPATAVLCEEVLYECRARGLR